MGVEGMIFLQSLSDLLLAHPFAIVDHLIQNTVFFSGNVDLHRALPDHTAETVVDGILYDRLQKEFQRFVVFQSRLHMDINKDPVEIFEVDQVDVVPDQIDLVLNPDDLPAVFGGKLHELDQGIQRRYHTLGSLHIRHPLDGIERVVDKMGIDLGLERHEFCPAQLDLRLVVFDGEGVDLVDHVLVAAGKAFDLHLIFRERSPAFFRFKALELHVKLLKRTCKDFGNKD